MNPNGINCNKYFTPCRTFGLRRIQKKTPLSTSPLVLGDHTPSTNSTPDSIQVNHKNNNNKKTSLSHCSTPLIRKSSLKMGLSKLSGKRGCVKRLLPTILQNTGCSGRSPDAASIDDDPLEDEFRESNENECSVKEKMLKLKRSFPTVNKENLVISSPFQNAGKCEVQQSALPEYTCNRQDEESECARTNTALPDFFLDQGYITSNVEERESSVRSICSEAIHEEILEEHLVLPCKVACRTYERSKTKETLFRKQSKKRLLDSSKSLTINKVRRGDESISLKKPKLWEALTHSIHAEQVSFQKVVHLDKEIEEIKSETAEWLERGQKVIDQLLVACSKVKGKDLSITQLLEELLRLDPKMFGYDTNLEEFIKFDEFLIRNNIK